LAVFSAAELNVRNIFRKQNMQMSFLHKVLSVDKQILHKNAFACDIGVCGASDRGGLGAQWQTYYCAVEKSRLAKSHLIEKLFELLELDRVVVHVDITFQVEICNVAAFDIVCESLVRVDKRDLLPTEY
jgi:hypothetical protein